MVIRRSVWFGPVSVSVFLLAGAASAHVLSPDSAAVGRVASMPMRLAAVPVCTLPSPDLSNLAFWRRYPKPGEPGAVLLPRALLTATSPCGGLVRQKTYVVTSPAPAPSDG